MCYSASVFLSLVLASTVFGPALPAQSSDAGQHLKDLAAANSLDIDGAKPWHLHMTFQLNDLNGKPRETGTIEEWWVSPHERRLEIRSSSYNLTTPSSPSGPPDPAKRTRESYLVDELLDQVVHPIPDYGAANDLKFTEAPRTFGGKLTLSCITVNGVNESSAPSSFCFAPGSTVLRGQIGAAQFVAVRNSMATFRGIELGLDNALAYGSKVAISGHIDKLESFQPNSSIAFADEESAPPSIIPGVVLAGKNLKKVSPIYPWTARQEHISGSVVICATISKQGTVTGIDVVSSPDSSLTASAIDAVKQWTYQPYLFKGSPVEVDTTITVNYNLNR